MGREVPIGVENGRQILKQVTLPLLSAGFGMAFAGIILDNIKATKIFLEIPIIYILLPSLLGLKGNLEMTMTSRLSSLANCGQLNTPQRSQIFKSNIALIECQSIVIGFSAALFALFMELIYHQTYQLNVVHIPMLCATSIITASLTSLILAGFMIIIVEGAVKYKINPDNVATPIAAALGDLVTLLILYSVSSFFHSIMENMWWFLVILIIFSLLVAKWLADQARKHPSTNAALSLNSWTPMFVAMFISSFSGCILSYSVIRFDKVAIYHPLVNGVGGNIAAIQASRLSSYIHFISAKKDSKCLEFVKNFSNLNPFAFLTRKDIHSLSARVLLSVVTPFHMVFYTLLNHLNDDYHPSLPINVPTFLVFYISATFFQVFVLLYLTGIIVMSIWSHGADPDNSSIPYLTSLGDLLGIVFLSMAFYFYEHFEILDQY